MGVIFHSLPAIDKHHAWCAAEGSVQGTSSQPKLLGAWLVQIQDVFACNGCSPNTWFLRAAQYHWVNRRKKFNLTRSPADSRGTPSRRAHRELQAWGHSSLPQSHERPECGQKGIHPERSAGCVCSPLAVSNGALFPSKGGGWKPMGRRHI
jgi:hypothetical protein